MAKRYRLEIDWQKVTPKNVRTISNLSDQEMDGMICTYQEGKDSYIFENGKDWSLKTVLSMLTEIKEPLARKEPESFESWRKKYKGTNTKCFEFQLMDAWFDGIKNYKLKKMVVDKEKDSQAFFKYWNGDKTGENGPAEDIDCIAQDSFYAALKYSRGL
ncbi:MAG: hypothetical protein QQN55_08615 [Nitrosopumilus sp.]